MLHFRCAYNLMQTLQLGIAKSNNPVAHSCFDFHVIHLKLKFRSKDQQKNFLIERHSISLRAFCGRITYGKFRGGRTLFLAECQVLSIAFELLCERCTDDWLALCIKTIVSLFYVFCLFDDKLNVWVSILSLPS